MPTATLQTRASGGGQVQRQEQGWRLSIPPGPAGAYRLAQVDDYGSLARREFPYTPPLTITLRARASAAVSPGTWGFGLWNEPLSAAIGFGSGRKLPALPQAAWFFFAAPENHLALRDELPGAGAMAASYRSASHPSLLLAPGVVALPWLAWRPSSRLLRRAAARVVQQEAAVLDLDLTTWHDYAIEWRSRGLEFRVDGQVRLSTRLAPRPPLGLVIWLDNQYAAWAPDGRLGYGTLANPASWIEIQDLSLTN